jgi:ABC-type transport system involved in multi-copper enzyme maturation permease subunit
MRSRLRSWVGAIGRFLKWRPGTPATRESWAIGLLLVGACLLASNDNLFTPFWLVTLWAGVLLALAFLIRRAYRRLTWVFGPVLGYDLVRTARRGQLAGHRCLYAAFLISIMLAVFWLRYPDLNKLRTGLTLTINERGEFGLMVFSTFMIVQMTVVFLVTPAYTAGAIAQEKERRTIDLLLTTELSDREIVLGMLGARLANLFLLVMTGLPILSLLEFLGGVDPNLVIGGFVATLASLLSLAALSILISVHARTTLTATLFTYLWMLFAIPLAIPFLVAITWGVDLSQNYVWGFLVIMLAYTLINVLIAWACGRAAVAELRNAALGSPPPSNVTRSLRNDSEAESSLDRWLVRQQQERGDRLNGEAESQEGDKRPAPTAAETPAWALLLNATKPAPIPRSTRPAPRIPEGEGSLLWKEVYLHRASVETRSLIAALVWAVTGILLFAFMMHLMAKLNEINNIGELTSSWVRGVGTPLACFLLLMIAFSSASRVSRERDLCTLDSLLQLPVRNEAILFAKWLGSILSVRWPAYGLLGLWGLGVLTRGLSWAALPFLLGAAAIYAACFAGLGLWFSASSRNTLRANLFTLLSGLVLVLGPGFLMRNLLGGGLYAESLTNPHWGQLLLEYGLTPSSTLNVLAFRSENLVQEKGLLPAARIFATVAGLQLYLALAAILWLAACRRLRQVKGPAPVAVVRTGPPRWPRRMIRRPARPAPLSQGERAI